jgi:hypothetical protein
MEIVSGGAGGLEAPGVPVDLAAGIFDFAIKLTGSCPNEMNE